MERKEGVGMIEFSYSKTYQKNLKTPLKKLFPVFGLQPILRRMFPFIRDHKHPQHTETEVGIILEFIKGHRNEISSNATLHDLLKMTTFPTRHRELQAAIIRYMSEWESEEGDREINKLLYQSAHAILNKTPVPHIPRSNLLP